jgi:hypothetical protein
MSAQIRAFREVLSQESVGVLVRAALPRTVRIAEVDRQAGIHAQLCVLSHLLRIAEVDRQAGIHAQLCVLSHLSGCVALAMHGHTSPDDSTNSSALRPICVAYDISRSPAAA